MLDIVDVRDLSLTAAATETTAPRDLSYINPQAKALETPLLHTPNIPRRVGKLQSFEVVGPLPTVFVSVVI